MLADATEKFKPNPTAIWLFVKDADAIYARALKAGATSIHEPIDQDYGDREASVKDPFGNHWYIATTNADAEPLPQGHAQRDALSASRGTPKADRFPQAGLRRRGSVPRSGSRGHRSSREDSVGDSIIAMGEAHGPYQPMPPALHLYVPDADRTYQRALQAGAVPLFQPNDAEYGDRIAGVTDPFGNVWYIATHIKDVPLGESRERACAGRESRVREEQSMAVNPILHTVMPFMYIKGADKAAEFYKKVLGATEMMRQVRGDIVSHVQIAVGDSRFMIRDPGTPDVADYVAKGFARTAKDLGGTPVHLYLYVADADAVFRRALAAGSKVTAPIEDTEWGDRCGGFQDPFGNIWYVATHIKDAD